jgi:iron complex outermembrane receptor protein
MRRFLLSLPMVLFLIFSFTTVSYAQEGKIKGIVTVENTNVAVDNAAVTIVQLKLSAQTDDNGNYEFSGIPDGIYTILVHLDRYPDLVETVKIVNGEAVTLDLKFSTQLREYVTVTATGSEQSTFEAIESVNTLESIQLAQRSQASIGEVLEHQPGIAKRSFGPGSSRPIIRGFDGDRVLVLQDGVRSGSLASMSGDHGETIDVLALDRIEVVKGPATLLYGGNAIGGVVNAIGRDQRGEATPGLRGYLNGVGASNNDQGGINGGLELGIGKWLFFGNGGGQRSTDYQTPLGPVINSKTRIINGTGGVGYFANKFATIFSYGYQEGRYGIPFAAMFESEATQLGQQLQPRLGQLTAATDDEMDLIDLAFRRHNARLNFNLRNLTGPINNAQFSFSFSDYTQKEIENDVPVTFFDNKEYVYRGVFEQKRQGRLSGSVGVSGYHRNYDVVGAETLSPPVNVNNFSAFALQDVTFNRFKLQFGGRIENNRYGPEGGLRKREFTGFSGAAGIRVPLGETTALVANYTSSYRAPALEELYNNGPHVGTLSFEIGNQNLKRERTDGIDFSVRHVSHKLRGEVNFFYYNIRNFVFLAPTGNINDGLVEAQYLQQDSRFVGTEANLEYAFHPNFTFTTGLDAVDAELKGSNSPLPRIPPLRGRAGLEARYKGFSIKPELLVARSQSQTFATETRTAGYGVVNLLASYTRVQKHLLQVFSVNAFNLNDRLYRNHTSLIKDFAPEIGRGVRFSYTLRFF